MFFIFWLLCKAPMCCDDCILCENGSDLSLNFVDESIKVTIIQPVACKIQYKTLELAYLLIYALLMTA